MINWCRFERQPTWEDIEVALVDLPPSVNQRRIGRPPLKEDMKVKKTTIWLHRPVVDRIVELVGSKGLSEFMREAAEAELTRREASSAEKSAPVDDIRNDKGD